MIKLFSVKEKQKQDAAAAAAGKPKQSAGELRVQKGGFAFGQRRTESAQQPTSFLLLRDAAPGRIRRMDRLQPP
jgi:hypothetical protein